MSSYDSVRSNDICDKPKSNKMPRNEKIVILHHHTTSPVMDDFVLFPDEVIVEKHSSIRKARQHCTSNVKARHASLRQAMLSSSGGHAWGTQESRHNKAKVQTDEKSIDDTTSSSGSEPPKSSPPDRLPTPDLSDVDEDLFWACCKPNAKPKTH